VNHGIAAASINRRLFQRYRRTGVIQESLVPDPVPSASKVAYTTPLAIKKKAMETDSFKIYG
jgi:hypothetical protein